MLYHSKTHVLIRSPQKINCIQIPNQSMVPQGVPMSHQIRPQSIAGLPQAQPQVPQQLQRPVSAPTGMGVQFVPVCRSVF